MARSSLQYVKLHSLKSSLMIFSKTLSQHWSSQDLSFYLCVILDPSYFLLVISLRYLFCFDNAKKRLRLLSPY